MSSSKKRRGRERKTAKQRGGGGISRAHPGGEINGEELFENFVSNTNAILVANVRTSHDAVSAARTIFRSDAGDELKSQRQALIDHGLLDVLLTLLQRCEIEEFSAIVAKADGDLPGPHLWVNLLAGISNTMEDCHAQIIDNIGPLVSCMCDDMGRAFFNSNQHWHRAMGSFTAIICSLLTDNLSKEIVRRNYERLSQYDDLFETMVQWWFWPDFRLDIMEEAKVYEVSQKQISARRTAVERATFALIEFAHSREELKRIGATPIVSNAYDANCDVSLVVGMLRRLETDNDPTLYDKLVILVGYADCIDEDVITEAIHLCQTVRPTYEHLTPAMKLVSFMLQRNTDSGVDLPSDTRTASAINSGLLEVCLEMVTRFGGNDETYDLMKPIDNTFQCVHLLALHKKTSRALAKKRSLLINVLERLKKLVASVVNVNERLTDKKLLAVDDECCNILRAIESIINITAGSCCCCNKPLERSELKCCSKCKCVSYCSKSCQQQDWQNGHMEDCNNAIFTLGGKASARKESDSDKLVDLKRNMMMIRKRLVVEHADSILMALAEQDLSVDECIVHFSLSEINFQPQVAPFTVIFSAPAQHEWYRQHREQGCIMCLYTTSLFHGDVTEEGHPPDLSLYKTFPLDLLKVGREERETKCVTDY